MRRFGQGRNDEHGLVNVIVWCDVADAQRRVLLEASLLGIDGCWDSVDGVHHLVTSRLLDMSNLLGELDVRFRDFR